jgi:3D (Asp-Asp-Asp) domain-containing protein
LPFGTKIKIPEIFGDKVFIVEDKMNPRYGENLDIWFPTKWEALNFGIHYDVLVEILE